MMMKFNLLLVASLFVIFSSCKRDTQSINEELPAYFETLIPYVDGETKVFVEGGNRITTTVSKKFEEYAKDSQPGDCIDCERFGEQLGVTLTEAGKGFPLIDMVASTDADNLLYISISPDRSVTFTGFQFEVGTDGVIACGGEVTCADTLVVNSTTTYTDVYLLERAASFDDFEEIVEIIYSLDKGVLRYQHEDGRIYVLEE